MTWEAPPPDPREEYYRNHYRCPRCRGNRVYQTYGGPVFDFAHPEDFRDANEANCQGCGWKGTVHDLLPVSAMPAPEAKAPPPEPPALSLTPTLAELRAWLQQPTSMDGLDGSAINLDAFVRGIGAVTANGGMEWTPQRAALLLFLSERLRKDHRWTEEAQYAWIQVVGCLLAQAPPLIQAVVRLDLVRGTVTFLPGTG